MGFLEEGRQLIQDFVTPEIRSIDARLTAVEKKLESLEARTDKRFDALEGRVEKFEFKVDKRIDSLEAKMERNHAQVMDTLRSMEKYDQIAERLARVESKLQHVA